VEVGSVRVTGGSQQSIDYTIRNLSYSGSEQAARREFENYKISATVHGDTARIVGEWQSGRSHRFSGELVIRVPREMDEVKVETEGGSVSTSGVTGRVEAESGGGNIHLDDIGGAISAETGGGGIEVGNVASDVSVHTGGGSIKVNSAKGKIVAESGRRRRPGG
jgi:Putative adhesin